MGKSCKWVIGLHRKPAPILTRSKKDRPDEPFSVKFFRRPTGRPGTFFYWGKNFIGVGVSGIKMVAYWGRYVGVVFKFFGGVVMSG